MNSVSQDAYLAVNDREKMCATSLVQLRVALAASWTAQTASPLVAWTPSNPSSGQCAVSALVLQDYCGGEIRRCVVAGTPHYFNRIDGQVVDSTAAQFGTVAINYDTATVRSCQRILRHADTRQRYELLKGRVERFLVELDVVAQAIGRVDYGHMGEDCLQEQTIWFGDNNDIVIVGEAPARTGWVESGVAWHNTAGKLLPSGVIMQKLLAILGKELLAVTFTEAIKCFPSDRRYLKDLAALYRPTLTQQLRILNPKLILTMGTIPTQALIEEPFRRLSDVVGKRYAMGGSVVIPIFHPSPISPRGYKDNIPIFESIREYYRGAI